jgi:hypothetical protein
VVKNTEDHPPDGRTCSTVVQFLRGLSKRKRGAFLGNAAEKQNLVVSAERGTVTCIPAAEQTDALPSGLRISLLHVSRRPRLLNPPTRSVAGLPHPSAYMVNLTM